MDIGRDRGGGSSLHATARALIVIEIGIGRCNTLTGQNTLTFDPESGLIHPDSIMRVGGWAVEKYL